MGSTRRDTMDTLKRSKDRKVTNLVTPNGKGVSIANTFGLPAGRAFSCPGATSVCESVCYAGRLEKVYKGVREVLMHNWDLLKDADEERAYSLLSYMVADFVKDCTRRGAPMLFRIHWDGDFFSVPYTRAWGRVIRENDAVSFWVYTRTDWAARMLQGIPNLSLYFSTDSENAPTGEALREDGIRLAFLADNFQAGQERMKELTGKPGARCPENTGQVPLISTAGSACVSCGLCVYNKADIVFSASKK
jgi:ferredoxin